MRENIDGPLEMMASCRRPPKGGGDGKWSCQMTTGKTTSSPRRHETVETLSSWTRSDCALLFHGFDLLLAQVSLAHSLAVLRHLEACN